MIGVGSKDAWTGVSSDKTADKGSDNDIESFENA
jgi:hypothetical protein